MNKISEFNHISMEKLMDEFERKQTVLKWMCEIGIENYEDVISIIRNYYLDPKEIYRRAKFEK